MKTRFTTYEQQDFHTSVTDIVEMGDAETEKATRARIMRQFGKLLDQMLDGSYCVDAIYVERDAEQS